MQETEYKPVHGSQFYRIGSDGSVWTCRAGAKKSVIGPWRQMRPYKDTCGYRQVTLFYDGVRKAFMVHRLVLEAFVGPCTEGMECLHADNNKDNCAVTNLSWGTHAENIQQAFRDGIMVPGGARIEFRGESLTLPAWAKRTGIAEATLRVRFAWGWSVEKALTTPVQQRNRCKLPSCSIDLTAIGLRTVKVGNQHRVHIAETESPVTLCGVGDSGFTGRYLVSVSNEFSCPYCRRLLAKKIETQHDIGPTASRYHLPTNPTGVMGEGE